jgi:hypothetical protein
MESVLHSAECASVTIQRRGLDAKIGKKELSCPPRAGCIGLQKSNFLATTVEIKKSKKGQVFLARYLFF